MNDNNSHALLLILDGWGHGRKDSSNAIFQANTPFIDGLYGSTPNAELRTDGENVGLPKGQMGNSEVGHLNIGAGRVVYQDLVRINKSIADGEFPHNPEFVKALNLAKDNDSSIHLMGLLSDGGIHSSQEHLHAMIDACYDMGLSKVYVHAFTDGRDTDPKSGVGFIKKLEDKLKSSTGQLASVIGRYYAMDRDKRWERIKKAYDLLLNAEGVKSKSSIDAINQQYNEGVTDEFLEPISIVDSDDIPIATINEKDVVICFNYRTDRCRQLSTALTQEDLAEYGMHTIEIEYFTMCNYDSTFKNVGVLFEKDNLVMTLGEVVSKSGNTQVRMAETEKYPHVTYFFSGGREKEFEGESRIMVNSPKVATYDLQPEMSAEELMRKACDFLEKEKPNLAILNFANPDMVGHTGVVSAIIKAVEKIDRCAKTLCDTALNLGYEIIIIADHGNAELNVNPDGSAHTSHTINPVPVFYIGNKFSSIRNGVLADVAPSLLDILDIDKPDEMTGVSLLK